jgi:dienelactone hydrolase
MLAARHQAIKAVVVYYGGYNPRQYRSLKLPPTVRVPIDVAAEVGAAALLLHGEADDEVPLSDAKAMEAALKSAGKVVELVVYPGAYHRFDRGPIAGARGERSPHGYTYRKDDAAAKDAFKRTVGWLRRYLGS